MSAFSRRALTAALLAAIGFATAGSAALAQSGSKAPVPSQQPAPATATLQLDNGRQWATDEPLRAGMGRIHALVEPRLAVARKLTPAQYGELGKKVGDEVGMIAAKSRLDARAGAMLGIVIADLREGAGAMAGKIPGMTPLQGLTTVTMAVNDYGKHFNHPGFKPLKGMH